MCEGPKGHLQKSVPQWLAKMIAELYQRKIRIQISYLPENQSIHLQVI